MIAGRSRKRRSASRNVYALDAGSGAVKWTSLTVSFVRSSPAVANGVVYVGSDDDTVYAFH